MRNPFEIVEPSDDRFPRTSNNMSGSDHKTSTDDQFGGEGGSSRLDRVVCDSKQLA